MSKTKKSKLLASMLCAAVMAGLHAAPVMAGDATITGGSEGIKNTINKDGDTSGNGIYFDREIEWAGRVFGSLTITPDQLAAGIKGEDVEFGKVTANTLSVGGKDVVKLNGSKVNVNADVINGGFLKVTNDNGKMVFAVDSKGAVKAANGNFGIADDGTVSVGGDETNGKAIINGTTGDITTKGNVYAVNGSFDNITTGTITAANGSFKVEEGNGETVVAGSMIYSKNQNGSYGMLNGNRLTLIGDGNKFSIVNGNVETTGTVTAAQDVVANGYSLAKIGENTQKISYDPVYEATKIDSHVMVNGAVIAGNNSLIGGVKLSDSRITASTALIAGVEIANGKVDGVDISELKDTGKDIEDLKNRTQGINYDNGVTDIAGVAQFSNGNMKVTGTMQVSGDKFVYTYQDENGNLRVGSLKAIDSSIDELYDTVGNVGGDLTALTGRVGTLETNTAGITNDKGVTVIDQGLKVKGEDGREVFSVARDGAINAVVTDGLGGTNANFVLNGENVELKYGNNGITANIDGTTISGNGTNVVVNENGTTFTNANGTTTVINGGAITAETLNGKNIDELISGVDVTNANVAGIKRDGETTTIEETLSVSKDGISANVGSSQLIVNDEVAGMTSGNASLALTNNEASLSAAGNSVVVNHDGVTFNTTNNGTTVINGGAITAETLNGADIDELIASVGTIGETNKNTAGIERKEVQTIDGTGYATVIEDGTVIGADGSFSTAFGKLTVEKNGRFSLSSDAWFGGDVNYKYVNKDGSISYGSLQDLTDRVSDLEDKTQNITGSEPGTGEGGSTVPPTTGGETGIEGDVTVGGDLTAGSGNIGGVTMEDGKVTAGEGNFSDKVTVGGENGTSITDKDVVINQGTDNEVSLSDVGNRVDNLEQGMASMSNRISKVEDRIDKVGAMSAAIANLRTMGYDPTAPTEIAVGIGQYRSETGAALGLFHYPNKDFMLSLSVSTSGDEVMGGIGATWKFGRKSPEQMLAAEKEKAAKAKLAKAEAMKKAAAEAKVAEQQAKHAKMAAEKAAK